MFNNKVVWYYVIMSELGIKKGLFCVNLTTSSLDLSLSNLLNFTRKHLNIMLGVSMYFYIQGVKKRLI